ncbi:hypothetical protein E2C01_078899 [Portunus trituberculatus]|uniref:Uncharacterized protein n=1 Tax=Portunus trituberculatus TaxID=210409 RepID=A0A5B7IFL0_PORTR|nr:hypothetical protein [Portunus trituberculatus]
MTESAEEERRKIERDWEGRGEERSGGGGRGYAKVGSKGQLLEARAEASLESSGSTISAGLFLRAERRVSAAAALGRLPLTPTPPTCRLLHGGSRQG